MFQFLFNLETGSHYIVQASLELLLLLSAGNIGVCFHTMSFFFFFFPQRTLEVKGSGFQSQLSQSWIIGFVSLHLKRDKPGPATSEGSSQIQKFQNSPLLTLPHESVIVHWRGQEELMPLPHRGNLYPKLSLSFWQSQIFLSIYLCHTGKEEWQPTLTEPKKSLNRPSRVQEVGCVRHKQKRPNLAQHQGELPRGSGN